MEVERAVKFELCIPFGEGHTNRFPTKQLQQVKFQLESFLLGTQIDIGRASN